jgi:hypothetical protein
MKQSHVVPFAWLLSGVVVIIGLVAWKQSLLVPFSELGIYDVFPLFGILAFSLMWAHYMVGVAVRKTGLERTKLRSYMTYSSLAVLFALLLHPGLLTYQMWRDGLGLPVNYVAPNLAIFVVLGQIAFLMFLAYELHRLYESRSWWHYVERASDVAMILILIHGYRLSQSLYPDWFTALWIFYGITFLSALVHSTVYRYRTTQKLL